MFDSGNARKYLINAVGEIALVVIGILIALQIKNWNQNKRLAVVPKIKSYISLISEGEATYKSFHDFHSNPYVGGHKI